jgi:hypothetical protein
MKNFRTTWRSRKLNERQKDNFKIAVLVATLLIAIFFVSRAYLPGGLRYEPEKVPTTLTIRETASGTVWAVKTAPIHQEEPDSILTEAETQIKVEIDKAGRLAAEYGRPILAKRNNNPCNLAYASQPGAEKKGRFASFDSPELGFMACIGQVELDQSRGKTLEKFLLRFAPPHENNTALYIKTVAGNLKIYPQTNIKNINSIALAKEIARFESQTEVTNF